MFCQVCKKENDNKIIPEVKPRHFNYEFIGNFCLDCFVEYIDKNFAFIDRYVCLTVGNQKPCFAKLLVINNIGNITPVCPVNHEHGLMTYGI